ncbi:MAG: gluconokinase [Anaerolineae bacterium]|jgi:gluconokinase|nr:gluconokinase [Anaerolineae bacterium]
MTLLVIDAGSSSVRALLLDEQAQPIAGALAQEPHTFTTDAAGASEADARHLQGLVESCLDAVLAHPAAVGIRAAGMAMFVGNVVGVGADGQPVTPLYTYADTRCAPEVQALAQQVDAADVHQRTGCPLHSAYYPARFAWLQRTRPHLWQPVHRWLDFGGYLYRQWFGVEVASYSAAAWSGLLHRDTLTWDAAWCQALHLPADRLPALHDYTAAQQGLRPEYARRWPALAAVPFFLAVGDGAAANVGSGAVDADSLALTVGTTAALRHRIPAGPYTVPPGLWCYRITAADLLPGGATFEGGNIFQWARQTFALPPPPALEAALGQMPAAAHGLTALPLLSGERSPGWRQDAVGTLHGLRLATTPLEILLALLEGVGHRLALVAQQIGRPEAAVFAGGGALVASPAWAQILCNALNRPLHLLAEPEVTARGVGLLLLHALDHLPLRALPPRLAQTLHPQPDQADRLAAARLRQVALYARLYAP